MTACTHCGPNTQHHEICPSYILICAYHYVQYVHNLCTSYKHLSLLSATPSQSNMYMCQSMGWSGESRAISKFCSLGFFKHRTPPCQEWYIHMYIHMCVICGRPVLSCKTRKSPGHTAAYSPLLLWQQDNLSSHSISGCTGSGHKLSKCTITPSLAQVNEGPHNFH